MKYILMLLLVPAAACTIRAVAIVETEDAAVSGETTVSRKQDPQVERQHSLFENIINKNPTQMSIIPRPTPTPEIEPELPQTSTKPPLFTEDELNNLLPESK